MSLLSQINAATKVTYPWHLSPLWVWMPLVVLLYLHWCLKTLVWTPPLTSICREIQALSFVPLQRISVNQFVLKVDSSKEQENWKSALGKHHTIIAVSKMYQRMLKWVDENWRKKQDICLISNYPFQDIY